MHKELIQGTEEWKAFRKNKIGGSDSSIIMDVSPWKTPYQLWEEKLSLVPQGQTTAAMKRGNDLEPIARQELERMTGYRFIPVVKFHPQIHWMIASLDGLDEDNKILTEIKCPGNEDHQRALSGEIPSKYYPQLQHQLEVCELEVGLYFSYHDYQGVIVKVYRDDAYIKKMLKKEKEFWDFMQDFVPPPLTVRDHKSIDTEEWKKSAYEWMSVNKQMKALEVKEKELRQNLISMTNNQSAIGGGVRLSRVISKGRVDYTNIPELSTVNLDKYRKEPSESWRISSV